MKTIWTVERTELLKLMWGEGYSGQDIANVIGFTRSSILGKVHRLQLPTRAVEVRAAVQRTKNVRRQYGSYGRRRRGLAFSFVCCVLFPPLRVFLCRMQHACRWQSIRT